MRLEGEEWRGKREDIQGKGREGKRRWGGWKGRELRSWAYTGRKGRRGTEETEKERASMDRAAREGRCVVVMKGYIG